MAAHPELDADLSRTAATKPLIARMIACVGPTQRRRFATLPEPPYRATIDGLGRRPHAVRRMAFFRSNTGQLRAWSAWTAGQSTSAVRCGKSGQKRTKRVGCYSSEGRVLTRRQRPAGQAPLNRALAPCGLTAFTRSGLAGLPIVMPLRPASRHPFDGGVAPSPRHLPRSSPYGLADTSPPANGFARKHGFRARAARPDL